MPDEINAETVAEIITDDASVVAPAVKKARVPRQTKVAGPASNKVTAAVPSPVKTRKPRKNLATSLASASESQVNDEPSKPAEKIDRRRKGAKAIEQAVTTHTAGDELADLLQLEEENKRLRQTLAEKLRAENADLRKKLSL